MKKSLKIILTVLLALAIVASLAWYLLSYDREFTRDMILKQARYQETRGNHSVAAWLYNRAYALADNDETVAIELANQFKSVGNYTKAEYTLTSAISNGGSSALYIALSRTYVEQDKLLDAVTMLENVADPQIREDLESKRPQTPTADYAPGFYSQYLSVTLSTPTGTLYYNTKGQFPSTADPVYDGPVALPAGETTIYAIAVGDDGLVSRPGIFGYTIGGVVEKVSFVDGAMESAIRQALGVSADKVLYTNDLWTLAELTVPEDAADYSDLALLTGLRKLKLTALNGDLSVLANLTALEQLDLSGTRPDDALLAVIGALPNLQKLTLADCGLSSVVGLEKAVTLTALDLSANTVRNIAPLSSLTALTELHLQNNALTDVSALSGLAALQTLDVSYNSVTSLSPLSGLANLTDLNAAHNSLSSAAGLERLTALTTLDLSGNTLSDVTALAGLTNLTGLNLSDNALTDLSPLAGMAKLATLDFSQNSVAALPAFPADAALVSVDGSHNELTSLDALGGLPKLNKVFMDYNKLTSVAVLADCPLLVQVNIYGNDVTDVGTLTALNIVVNYTPATAG